MQIKCDNVTAEFMVIDKKIADEFLLLNVKNRPLNKKRIDKYVKDMKTNYWSMNGDAIRFCDDGTLIDGQHRLTAISQANYSSQFLVIRNIKSRDKRTIDSGASRTGANVLAMFAGLSQRDSSTLSRAISRLIAYQNGRSAGLDIASIKANISLSEIEKFYEENGQTLNKALAFIAKAEANSVTIMPRSDSVFLYFIFHEKNEMMAEDFMFKVISGLGIDVNTNEHLYRLILTKRLNKTLKLSPAEIIYTGIKAWNKTREEGIWKREGALIFDHIKERPMFAK